MRKVDDIPADCCCEILGFFSEKELNIISSVSKKWPLSVVSTSDRLWNEKYEECLKKTDIDEERLRIVRNEGSSYHRILMLRRQERIYRIENPPIIETAKVYITILGDRKVGKTCFSVVYSNGGNCFPDDWVPSIMEDYNATILYRKCSHVSLTISDSSGDLEKDSDFRLKRTNAYILCFNVMESKSLESVKDNWAPKLRKLCPGVPTILCGLQTDLRDNAQIITDETYDRPKPVSTHEGESVAEEIESFGYFEVTSKHLKGLNECFVASIDAAFENKERVERLRSRGGKKGGKKKGKGGCLMM